ncbi:MAG: hypothetical protein JO320_02755 [Alphaproteobacteria bacterium]|nr:hypothetical protein [Alphaproteobacteria bacterium]MBV9373976.1 hypothetical protein [Alphaproteobacteria bacterium]
MLAIALPGLIGIGALGAETGVWFTIKLQNQAAVDAAAIAAAYGVIAGKTDVNGELTMAAEEAARRNGYKGSVPTVVTPYSDGVITKGVAVTLQQSQGALLAAMFLSSVTIEARAVAVIEALDNPCILALGTGGTDVEIGLDVQLGMNNCSVAANSISSTAIDLSGSTSSIIAATIVTAGELAVNGTAVDPASLPPEITLSIPPLIGAPQIADPYASILTHAFLTAGIPNARRCGSNIVGGVQIYHGNCIITGSSLTHPKIKLAAGTRISGEWVVLTGQTIDLSPGSYWVTGDLSLQPGAVFQCSACDNVEGAGVTIILTTQTGKVGALSVAGDAVLNLNAPHSGQFAGLVVIQDSNDLPYGTTYTSTHSSIGGSAGSSLNGLIYFPNSSLTFHGSPGSFGPKCLLLVSSTVKIDAPSGLDAAGCVAAGLTTLPVIGKVALAE